jgi:hypothetical protein
MAFQFEYSFTLAEGWKKVEPRLPDEIDLEKAIRLLNFCPACTYGEDPDCGVCIEVFEYDCRNPDEDPEDPEYRFLCWYSLTGDSLILVYIPEYPDLAEFLRLYGPVVTGFSQSELVKELRDGFRKLFRATHQHDVTDMCWACDPAGMQRHAEWRAEMRKKSRERELLEADEVASKLTQ